MSRKLLVSSRLEMRTTLSILRVSTLFFVQMLYYSVIDDVIELSKAPSCFMHRYIICAGCYFGIGCVTALPPAICGPVACRRLLQYRYALRRAIILT